MSDRAAALAAIANHHCRFGPSFGPDDQVPGGFLSNHLPMAALARLGLNDKPARVLAYMRGYEQALTPIDAHPEYRARLQHFLDAVVRNGAAATLAEHLPRLIAGWVRDAYHPLIRIAYGWEFGIEAEVAAGLAYFDIDRIGADARIAELAASATASEQPPATLFAAATGWGIDLGGTHTFTQAAQRIIDSQEIQTVARVLPDNLERMSLAALDVFAATHNFFALHLVTASHAFRLLYDFAGPHADAILNLGLVAGYAAIGAPPVAPQHDTRTIRQTESEPVSLLTLCGEDEHDYKVAYSAVRQASYFADPRYVAVTREYLSRKRGSSNDP